MGSLRANGAAVTFTVKPSIGTFAGQAKLRRHPLQLRGLPLSAVASVSVSGRVAPHQQPSGDSPGWYVASGGDDQRDALTEPTGTLVIACGAAVDIRDELIVKVEMNS